MPSDSGLQSEKDIMKEIIKVLADLQLNVVY